MLQNYKILNFFKNKKIILLSCALFSLTSCVETIVISTGVGGALAYREKTIDDTRSDIKISTKIGLKFISNGLKTPKTSIDITVNEGRVMLTGIARDTAKAKLAQELCWQFKGVNEVIDEIQIREDGKGRHGPRPGSGSTRVASPGLPRSDWIAAHSQGTVGLPERPLGPGIRTRCR